MDESQYLSFLNKSENLAKFSFELIKNAFKGGGLTVSAEIQSKRLEICKSCDWYDDVQPQCKHCGCFLPLKVAFALDSCPIGKWKENEETWIDEKFEEILEKTEHEQKSLYEKDLEN